MKLVQILLFIEILFLFSKAMKFSDFTLKTAVGEWCSDINAARTKYGDINTWDVSDVTNMVNLFRGNIWNGAATVDTDCKNFNSDIGNWNVGKVTDMSYMFYYATSFDRDISNWDTGNVILMRNMFDYAGYQHGY